MSQQQKASPRQATKGLTGAKHGDTGSETVTCTNGAPKSPTPGERAEAINKTPRPRITRIKVVRGNRFRENLEKETAKDAITFTDNNNTDTNMADVAAQAEAAQEMMMQYSISASSGDEAASPDLPPQSPEFIAIYDSDKDRRIRFFANRASGAVLYNRHRAGDEDRFLQFYHGGELIKLVDLHTLTYVYEKEKQENFYQNYYHHAHAHGHDREAGPWADVYRGSTRVASWNLVTYHFRAVFTRGGGGGGGGQDEERRHIVIKTW